MIWFWVVGAFSGWGVALYLAYHLIDGPWVKYPKGSGWSGEPPVGKDSVTVAEQVARELGLDPHKPMTDDEYARFADLFAVRMREKPADPDANWPCYSEEVR